LLVIPLQRKLTQGNEMKKITKGKRDGVTRYIIDLRKDGGGRKYFSTEQAAQDYLDHQVKQLEGVRKDDREQKTEWTFDALMESYIDELNYKGKNIHNKIRTMFFFKDLDIAGCKLADMKVRDFLVGDVNTIYKIIRVGRTQKTISEALAHFRQLLNYAVLESVVSMNVFSQLPNGAKLWEADEPKKLGAPLSEELVHKIADQMEGQKKLMYLFAAYSGLRSGELRALTWKDLDFDKGEISIDKTARHIRANNFGKAEGDRSRGSFDIIPETKTIRGTRKVPLLDFLIQMLREYKLSKKFKSDLVFESRGGKIISDSRFPTYIREAADKANVAYIRWHDLRHYYASQLLKIYNDDWNRIKTYMGHANIQTTINIYGHWIETEEEKKDNRNLLNEKLGKIAAR